MPTTSKNPLDDLSPAAQQRREKTRARMEKAGAFAAAFWSEMALTVELSNLSKSWSVYRRVYWKQRWSRQNAIEVVRKLRLARHAECAAI